MTAMQFWQADNENKRYELPEKSSQDDRFSGLFFAILAEFFAGTIFPAKIGLPAQKRLRLSQDKQSTEEVLQ